MYTSSPGYIASPHSVQYVIFSGASALGHCGRQGLLYGEKMQEKYQGFAHVLLQKNMGIKKEDCLLYGETQCSQGNTTKPAKLLNR